MGEEGKKEADKKERRFSQEQYDILKRCSDKKDMTEWNEWREKNPDEEIWLQGADLGDAHLENANLLGAHLENADLLGAHLENADLEGAHLENADLGFAHLKNAYLEGAHLENARLSFGYLENAYLEEAYLENANLGEAYLENAFLFKAHLENAKLLEANLKGANLDMANLQGADLLEAHLEEASFKYANLRHASFRLATINGATTVWECIVDKHLENTEYPKRWGTDFSGVGLGSIQIDAGTKQLLEYNIRRMNWEEWYKEHWFLRWPVQAFWAMSDYGMSTLRVMGVFFILALLFAAVYMNWAYWAPPGIVNNLIVQPEVGEAALHYFGRVMIRPIYFSVVTMTTLGFGDMYANKGSIAGHVLLILQVILGYVLLGALVTRFAVLFTAGGPAGKFAKGKEGNPQHKVVG